MTIADCIALTGSVIAGTIMLFTGNDQLAVPIALSVFIVVHWIIRRHKALIQR
jgi:hypothetical protein